MTDQSARDDIHWIAHHNVVIEEFTCDGFILDIGGGGEGIIGQLKSAQVVAIDLRREELEESAPGPLKIVMDARDMQFLDNTFAAATAFYALMYMPLDDHAQVFREIFRVLQPGGEFRVWDTAWPEPTPGKRIHAVRVTITVNDHTSDTGYGIKHVDPGKNLAHYAATATAAGFEIVVQRQYEDLGLYLRLRKPE